MDTSLLLEDDELEAAALAADPDAVVPDDAIPFADWNGTRVTGALPAWYMATPMAPRTLRGWRRLGRLEPRRRERERRQRTTRGRGIAGRARRRYPGRRSERRQRIRRQW